MAGWTASAVAAAPRSASVTVQSSRISSVPGTTAIAASRSAGAPFRFGDDQVQPLQTERAGAEAQQGDPVGG